MLSNPKLYLNFVTLNNNSLSKAFHHLAIWKKYLNIATRFFPAAAAAAPAGMSHFVMIKWQFSALLASNLLIMLITTTTASRLCCSCCCCCQQQGMHPLPQMRDLCKAKEMHVYLEGFPLLHFPLA